MIIELLCQFAAGIFKGIFGLLEVFSLPLDMIMVLTNIIKFGSWVVGADLLLLFVGSVVFWWGVRATFGIVVWIWRMLPLT